MRIHLIPNSHIDPVWLWDKQEGIDEVLNTFRSACSRLDENPGLTFSTTSLQFYEWAERHDSGLFDRIGEFVAAGRWEVVGSWWIEPDTNLPLTESLMRQAQFGRQTSQAYFGCDSPVACLPDTFGHPASLPKILAESGFRYFVFNRPNATEKPDLPADLFHWEYKGHRVLAYRFTNHYSQIMPCMADCPDTDDLRSRLDDEAFRTNPVNGYMFGVGDHGGGPSKAEITFYNTYIAEQPPGDIGYSSCRQFFEEAERQPNIPVYAGDLHFHAVGCYSVLRDVKTGVRESEQALMHASRALKMAGRSDGCLDEAWKTTLFNQFHDILPGSCSPSAADDANAELGSVRSFCKDTAYGALRRVSRHVAATVPEGEFRIFNTLPFEIARPVYLESFQYFRNGVFSRGDGTQIAIQEVRPSVCCANRRWEFIASLPAAGFESYYFEAGATWKQPEQEITHFQTDTEIDPALPDVRFLLLDDKSDTWGHDVERYDNVLDLFTLESSSVLDGPVTRKLYQRWTCAWSSVDAVWSAFAGVPGLFVDLQVLWNEHRKILKLEFPAANGGGSTYTMQGAGGPITRAADGREQPLHQWLWVPQGDSGMAVLQDAVFAGDCLDGRLRLNLVRSSIYGLHEPWLPNAADPQHRTDQGVHRMRLRFLPDVDLNVDWLEQMTATFLEPCSVLRVSP